MSLQTRELPGVMLLGLSDNAYAFVCKFGTIRLHSFISALVLFRGGGVFRHYQFMRTVGKWLPSPVFLKLPTFYPEVIL
jgi:hypothetical protein